MARVPCSVQNVTDQNKLDKVEYFNERNSMIQSDARCTHEMKCRVDVAKTAFNMKKSFFV
jgi:hypothetical protein